MPPTHVLLWAVQPGAALTIVLLVLFTFNVTETENTSEQPFITWPEKAKLIHHFSTVFAPSIAPHCLSFPPFVSILLAFMQKIPFHTLVSYLSPFFPGSDLKAAS